MSFFRSFVLTFSSCAAVIVAAVGVDQLLRADEPKEAARVLMLTQSKGFEHQPVKRGSQDISPAELAMRELGVKSGLFRVDWSQDAATDFTRDNLQNYDLIMLYTSGDLPIAENDLEYFLNDWLKQSGHGLIGFHSATDTYREHQPYWDMIGGTFNGHPWTQNQQVTIAVHDLQHPTMKPFGDQFEIQDEIYQYRHWQPEKVRVLMSLNMAECQTKRPWHVPVAWCKAWGKGRIFVTNLGHREETWGNEMFLESVIGAVKWIQGAQTGDATPNPELSAQQEILAKQAANEAGITIESVRREEEEKKRRQAERKRKKN